MAPSPLTGRQQEIVAILAQFSAQSPATVADISKELQISSRTVLRELPAIEAWLQGQHVDFVRKPGVGIALSGTAQERQAVVDQLKEDTASALGDKTARRRLLLASLLSSEEPVKSMVYAKTYGISEGTLATDLDFAQEWLAQHGVTLHRKTGLGIYRTGPELRLRRAMAALVYEWMEDGALSSWFLWGNASGSNRQTKGLYTLGLLQQSGDLPSIREILTQTANAQGLSYTDQGFLSMVVHMAIAILRIRQGHHLEQANALAGSPSQLQLADAIAQRIEQTFSLTLSPAERTALTLGLMGSIAITEHEQDPWDVITLRRTVLELIAMVETELNTKLRQDSLLVADLMRHLQTTLRRLQLGIASNNTHGAEIQKAYPTIYQATTRGLTTVSPLSETVTFGQSEIALIAAHFCAAVERAKSNARPMRVVVTCPMGMGTSRILVANIEKQFPQIQVEGVVSTRALTSQWLKEQSIDLVVSTVLLDLDFPHVCVSPILNAQDKRALQAFAQQWVPSPLAPSPAKQAPSFLNDTLAYVQDLSQELRILLTHIPLVVIPSVDSKEALLSCAAGLFASDAQAEQTILQDLTDREAISETYIDQGNTLLLHCKTSGTLHCRLGYIRLDQPLDNQGNQVLGAIVMVAPQDARQVHVEMMGHICSAFLNNEALYLATHQGTQQELSAKIQEILGLFYTNTLHLI